MLSFVLGFVMVAMVRTSTILSYQTAAINERPGPTITPLSKRYLEPMLAVLMHAMQRVAAPSPVRYPRCCHMLLVRMPQRKIRFAVGAPDGPRSAIWSIVAQKYDAYIVPVELKGVVKISLHLRTGEFSWGYTREFFDENRAEIPERAKQYGVEVRVRGRDFERWKRPAEYDKGLTLPFRIYVANEALQAEPDLQTKGFIRWVEPRAGSAVGFVFLLLASPVATDAVVNYPDLELVGRLEFPAIGESIVVVAHHIASNIVSDAANRSIVEFTREHPGFKFPEKHRFYAQTTVEPGTESRNLIEIPTYAVVRELRL